LKPSPSSIVRTFDAVGTTNSSGTSVCRNFVEVA
jgi:hypothetical protein